MPMTNLRIQALATCIAVLGATAAHAQLPDPNEAGVSMGHIHLMVQSPADHADLWQSLGGDLKSSAPELSVVAFPGVYVLVSAAPQAVPSSETIVNHVGFSIRDYANYRARLDEIDTAIVYESAEDGQVIADLPDGVRLELLRDETQETAIAFHHVHLATSGDEASLRDWYLNAFGARPGERRGLPSALVPGGRVDVMPARGQEPQPSQRGAIHHIGFEVAEIETFAAEAERRGIEFDRPPSRLGDNGPMAAFLTDPAGTFIELTEGLEGAVD